MRGNLTRCPILVQGHYTVQGPMAQQETEGLAYGWVCHGKPQMATKICESSGAVFATLSVCIPDTCAIPIGQIFLPCLVLKEGKGFFFTFPWILSDTKSLGFWSARGHGHYHI